MTPKFRSIEDVLGSSFLSARVNAPYVGKGKGKARILKSTRLEDSIYSDLRAGDADMDALEGQCTSKLSTFPALMRDIYQSVYSLNVRKQPEEDLCALAKRFNAHIMDSVMTGDTYPTLKTVCEGRQLPAYEAACEFTSSVAGDLDQLLQDTSGDSKALDTLERLEEKWDASLDTLRSLLEQRGEDSPDPKQDAQIVKAANTAQSQCRQAEAVGKMVADTALKNGEKISALVDRAAKSAAEKAEETALALSAWGTGDTDDSPAKVSLDREILQKVHQSPRLQEVTRHLGRFKEILARARKNAFAYGRGETYSLEVGGCLNRALSSEFALLAISETIPLFLRKLQRRQLKQYARREAVYKGCGDIICCIDESASTTGAAAWGKAVALTLLDAAMSDGRKFALIHFASRNQFKTDLFLPGQYTGEDVIAAAETFLGGNTNFETPLREALRLMEQEGFENADIVFSTDGICELPTAFVEELHRQQAERHFTVTGVLLDQGVSAFPFSLTLFCNDIYRTSELADTEIVASILSKRV